ncbi:polysaccharide deacetylase family protein [Singulisphaera sp. Ch08]|uniref:Polysaccharide deacetylase family protein n=1 Tax=Singulisphaera sp. Ch08 TaxID=3120278 RepID=A0AAU7CK92_9BACT
MARAFNQLGLTRLLERAARRPAVLVATFHRIGNPANEAFYDGVYSASPEAFRAQVRHLRDRFRLVTLDTLIAMADADSEFAVDRPTALITFDDGYRDNFDVAFPILQELGAPATFFIPTGFYSRPQVPWWDHTAYVLKRTSKTRITLDWPEPVDIHLEQSPRTTANAIAAVVQLYLDGKVDDEARFRTHLEERAEVVLDDNALGQALFMTWDQVRHLADSGMTIGSHAHDHRALTSLSETDQRHELIESKRILEYEVGREIEALAYPFGWAGTFDDQTQRLTHEAGYRLAFSSAEGVNRPGESDLFALRRLNVGYHDSAPLFRARTALQTSFGTSFL